MLAVSMVARVSTHWHTRSLVSLVTFRFFLCSLFIVFRFMFFVYLFMFLFSYTIPHILIGLTTRLWNLTLYVLICAFLFFLCCFLFFSSSSSSKWKFTLLIWTKRSFECCCNSLNDMLNVMNWGSNTFMRKFGQFVWFIKCWKSTRNFLSDENWLNVYKHNKVTVLFRLCYLRIEKMLFKSKKFLLNQNISCWTKKRQKILRIWKKLSFFQLINKWT